MDACANCGAHFSQPDNFCSMCGTRTTLINSGQQSTPGLPLAGSNPHHVAARGFAQIFGLHPAVAVLTIAVDLMLFGKDGLMVLLAGPTAGVSLGLALAISCFAGVILGIIAYMGQRKWFGDDKESAIIKAAILAFLTAIPTSIPSLLFASFGLIGFFRRRT
jgi:hypothetical protein